ncbi:response regulator [Bacillus megaterium]|nr:response regulator [Priestia megaterium]
MLDILIVDDDSIKIGKIVEVLNSIPSSEEFRISKALDIDDARKLIHQVQFDLLILDIQLPMVIGKDVKRTGGVTLLNEINQIDRIKKPLQIVGITSFDDAKLESEDSFYNYLWSIIKYNPSTEDWKSQLKNKLRYLVKTKKQSVSAMLASYNYDIAVITAVKVEWESIMRLPANWKKKEINGDSTEYWEVYFENDQKRIKVIAAQQHQMGMAAAAVLATKVVYHFRPKYLSMVGICAGNKQQGIELGDIIVAAESWDYGSGKIKEQEGTKEALFQPEPHQIAIDIDLKEKFLKHHDDILFNIYGSNPASKPRHMLRLHVGAMASGASVIQNESIVEEYIDKHNRKLLGIEMEIYSIYYAAKNVSKPRPTVFAIKSVCDFADSEKVTIIKVTLLIQLHNSCIPLH